MLDKDGFIVSRKDIKADLKGLQLKDSAKPVILLTDQELLAIPVGSVFTFDIECYSNFFFVAFKHLDSGKFVVFEKSPDSEINPTKLRWMLWRFLIVGFNSKNYDMPLIELALKGASLQTLKEASDYIIIGEEDARKVTSFNFQKKYNVEIGNYNHIDLIEVAPLQGSLKLYTARIHCERIQDLPFSPETFLTKEDSEITKLYCCNDLENTELLFKELAGEIKLRTAMTLNYAIDLRSKSDAQIAELVINSELKKVLGYYPKRPELKEGEVLKYFVPDFICFRTDNLKNVLEIIRNTEFILDAKGSPEMPKSLEKLKVKIGKSYYKLGMGGLHSMEKQVAHYADENTIIEDNDVESFYPKTIINQKLFPSHLGESFLYVYEDKLVNPRLAAKAMSKKETDPTIAAEYDTKSNSFKIVINGSFGKFGNKYSTLYAPRLMLQVTITGQLVLLMLIEAFENIGIEVISANTDGIILKYNKSRYNEVRALIEQWEKHCNYKTESTKYKAVYSRDVNNYIAIKEKGKESSKYLDERLGCKTKGAYSERGSALNSILSKNPESLICIDAVLNYLAKGIPIADTIKNCKDFRRFVSVRNVKGGGEKNGIYLGKVVRWYYAKNEAGYIAYSSTGNKVAKTDGAKPAMTLPKEFPNDIDYLKYIAEAKEILSDIGANGKNKTLFDLDN